MEINNSQNLFTQITKKILNGQPDKTRPVAKPENPVATQQETQDQEYIHPILTTNDFKETIKKYNLFVRQYNIEVYKLNKDVRAYNREVKAFRKGLLLSDEERIKEELWKKRNRDCNPKTYNERVELYNKQKGGLFLQMRNLRQEVKKDSEKVFIAILHQFNQQLYKRKEVRSRLGVHIASALPKVELYPNKITSVERDGYVNLPVSVKTFKHHRERLEECGVLTEYEFKGSKRAVKMRINPEILTLTDNKKQKNADAENQRVTPVEKKKVPHNNVSSRTYSDKNQVRDERSLLPQTDNDCTGSSTGTPGKRITQKNLAGQENKPISQKLLPLLDDQTDLAKELAAGEWNEYTPIFKKYVHEEALRGSMLQEDFKELAIQDIFKYAAGLFKQLEVHPGCWQNAFKYWMADKFLSPNGYILSKPIIAERWKKSLRIIKEAYKFQKKHPQWQIRYPSIYFDTARTDKGESSFEYAYRNFRLEPKPAKSKKARQLAHLKTTRKLTDAKKAREAARKYVQGKMSLQALFEFVQHNCNSQVMESLNAIIKKEFDNHHKTQ